MNQVQFDWVPLHRNPIDTSGKSPTADAPEATTAIHRRTTFLRSGIDK